MNNSDVIIIGAGAAGLMAAKYLAEKNKKIIVLEARDRTGGRINTINDGPFDRPVELGAEFVHGNLPLTLGLFKDAGITYYKKGGQWWQPDNGQPENGHGGAHWKLFEEKLGELEEDMTLDALLNKYFSEDKYASLRDAVRRYASGFDNADPAKASAMALKEEWLNEDPDENYMPTGGYSQMTDHLANVCRRMGCAIYTNTVVKQVNWERGKVSVISSNGYIYIAAKVLITVPLGVLQAGAHEEGAITIIPALPEKTAAIKELGIGALIKVLLQFGEAFWESNETEKRVGKNLSDLGFLLSQEAIPTWWTQYPAKSSLLTGWLGGPAAAALAHADDDTILELSLNSLAHIFKTPADELKQMLTTWRVINWTTDPYSRGSYSYATVAAKEARKVLAAPVQETIYFAGEALYEGAWMGTVEAALSNGLEGGNKLIG